MDLMSTKSPRGPIILAIESSCDDTSAAVIINRNIHSNIIYSQTIHEAFGGVVPELASRKHEQKIVPVVDQAIKQAEIQLEDIDAIAFTKGPGLVGSLLVGLCFAKSLALALNVPMIDVNHMQAHALSCLIEYRDIHFPIICMTVSGGHTQLVYIKSELDMEVLGTTIDDAAGEAFDKAAKMLGLDYPGGPMIDELSKDGDPLKFTFSKPRIDGFDYSFSGLKTSILYFLQKQSLLNKNFIQENLADLCASIQHTIISILMDKLDKLIKVHPVKGVAIAGGVSANSGLRSAVITYGSKMNIPVFIPSFQYCTDNAAMIAHIAHYKFLKNQFCDQNVEPVVKNYSL